MNVLLVASEAGPFIKTGGLGDVMGALPRYLKEQGVEARVVIPKYKGIKSELKEKLIFKQWFTVPVGWRNRYCGIFECELDGVVYYLLDNEFYFDRDGAYGFFDDAERFAFFDRAVLMFIKQINWKPDVIHCNDWQTGMIPVMYQLEYNRDPFYYGIKTVYSIHNLLYQGVFDPEILPELFGYDMEPYLNKSVEFDKGVSFMKGGINYCDKISTVSYSYANEIRTPEFGRGLDGILRQRGYDLCGILNGIDYEEYNPKKDENIRKNFGKSYMQDKRINKMELQKELSLPVNPDIPVIGIVTRLTGQKGIDLIMGMADRLLQQNVQLVILGNGEGYYEEFFWNLESRYRQKVSANIRFDNSLAHRIYAGSDIFYMPSLFEPCGLGQLIALRYGSIPIVRETGGLRDTITPYNEHTGIGNGFSFVNYSADELLMITEYALRIYWDKWRWTGIVNQAMHTNNSWKKSAADYKKVYKYALGWQ